jgi:hypothetical protein
MNRALWRALAGSLVCSLAGCGGGSGPTPVTTTTTTLPPCTQSILLQATAPFPASSVDLGTVLPVGTAGRFDVTLDWTFTDSPIGVFLTASTDCTTLAQFNARSCNFLIRSEPGGAKPRKVSAAVPAGSYRFMVANFASRDESLATTVVLSSTTCPPLTSAREAASGATGTAAAVELKGAFR